MKRRTFFASLIAPCLAGIAMAARGFTVKDRGSIPMLDYDPIADTARRFSIKHPDGFEYDFCYCSRSVFGKRWHLGINDDAAKLMDGSTRLTPEFIAYDKKARHLFESVRPYIEFRYRLA